jgi:DNA-binding transcriptional MerR regulator
MEHRHHNRPDTEELPPIPAKRYFTIGEVSELCCVKPHVLRYWEQEFTQLKSVVKRRGNRRYYQHHEVLLVRRIRELLYSQCFTISGARNRLEEELLHAAALESGEESAKSLSIGQIRAELQAILQLLDGTSASPESGVHLPPPHLEVGANAALKAAKARTGEEAPPSAMPELFSESSGKAVDKAA